MEDVYKVFGSSVLKDIQLNPMRFGFEPEIHPQNLQGQRASL